MLERISTHSTLGGLLKSLGIFAEEILAKIFLSERLIAKLTVGARPGWSSLVTKDGPLAKKMADFQH
ncbi:MULTISPECIES: hypothetical protein [Sphingobacterium]|uniref:hypothetical protein n=1 Tax=Sphingobacterium TaxID=28453 RepID=UPI000B48BA31|nr:hypothetical protein [Sphingobacterium sp. G1-14]